MDMHKRGNAIKKRAQGQRGAALVVALAILAIIVAIAIAFFSTTRLELTVSTNVANSARADMAANAALSMAAAFLNHDLLIHSTYTSLDFAAFTYFNGAWAAGKDWAFPNNFNESWQTQIFNGDEPTGIPLVDMDAIRFQVEDLGNTALTDNPANPFQPPFFYNESGHLLYVPRYQGPVAADILDYASAFLIDQTVEFPKQTIHRWADVDNDEDGWRDSVWIPIPADTIVGNKDLDGDNIVVYDFNPDGYTGTDFIDSSIDLVGDLIDNNLNNGFASATSLTINNNTRIDINNNIVDIDDNLDALPNDDRDGIDEVGEVAMFLYRGHADNRDNDADTLVDEEDEDFIDSNGDGIWTWGETRVVFLTAPVDVDFNETPGANFLEVVGYNTINFPLAIDTSRFGPFQIKVDRVDNDYDFILNQYDVRTFDRTVPPYDTLANDQQRIALIYELAPETRAMQRIADQYVIDPNLIVFATAEPQTEIVGRAAVLIRDTASQVHLNAMGAYRDLHDTSLERDVLIESRAPGDIVRASNEGLGPHEYISSFLHQIGDTNGRTLWQDRLGAPGGLPSEPFGIIGNPLESFFRIDVPGDSGLLLENYLLDSTRPGYGGVDDDGNLLIAAMNGIDDDGDGFIDEGLNPLYPDMLNNGQFEGIDDPGEYRYFQPYRNDLAERDGRDNDIDGFIDELGEMGDRVLRDESEVLGPINETADLEGGDGDIAQSLFERENKGFTTIHSSDKGTIGQQRYTSLSTSGITEPTPTDRRGASALKLDYNYAPADVIARTLRDTYGYAPTWFTRIESRRAFDGTDLSLPANNDELLLGAFSKGWRTQGVNFYNTSNPSAIFEADGELHANQLAVNIRDFRDGDHAQSRVTTTEEDDWWSGVTGGDLRLINYTQAGTESIRINEIMVRPVRRIEAEMLVPGSPIIGLPGSNAGLEFLNFNPNQFQLYPAVLDFNMELEIIPDDLNVLYWRGPWEDFAANTFDGDVDPDPALQVDRLDTAFGGTSALLMNTTDATVTNGSYPVNTPNMAVFTFRPGPGLPPGRYYMTVNTQQDIRVPSSYTVAPSADTDTGRVNASQIRFLTKYVSDNGVPFNTVSGRLMSTGTQGILADFQSPAVITPASPDVKNGNAIVGGPDNGWMFLATDAFPPIGGGTAAGYLQDEAYTVQIPPYDADADFRLEVAIWVEGAPANLDFALNFFDFSQEPDQEWIEIVNIAESSNAITETNVTDGVAPLVASQDVIDISGWELEIGTDGDEPIVFTIPEPTLIEPGGHLILAIGGNDGTTNFDGFLDYPSEQLRFPNDFNRNGIGMVSLNLSQTTPPSIQVLDPTVESQSPANGLDDDGDGLIDEAWVDTSPTYLGGLDDPFFFSGDFDLVDVNGNGIEDAEEIPFGLVLPGNFIDNNGPANSFFGSTGNRFTNAGDRIIFLTTNQNNLPLNDDLPGTADRVLSGGFLPNYPERDGIDNDGDKAVLLTDGIDNDGDGLIDELAEVDTSDDGLNNDGDVDLDEADEVSFGDTETLVAPFGNNNGIIDGDEGVDEGRWYIRPSPSAIVTETFADDYERPGSYQTRRRDLTNVGLEIDELTILAGTGVPVAYDLNGDGIVGPGEVDATVHSSADAPPEWRSHIEKRWYPGDAVKVTLYAGPKASGEIADQVSYTEQDVINISAYDVDAITPTYDALVDTGAGIARVPSGSALRPDALSFWQEDNMSLDFYRSLERKHPLYAGDMAGTSNRWEATDGAYDDWDSGRTAAQLNGSRWTSVAPTDQEIRLLAHQFNASPLRQNYWQRQVADNGFYLRDIAFNEYDYGLGAGAEPVNFANATTGYDTAINATSFPAPDPIAMLSAGLSAQGLESVAPYRSERRFTLDRLAYRYGTGDGDPAVIYQAAAIRNKAIVSTGDLATMPMMVLNRSLYDTTTIELSGPSFDGVAGVLLGETSPSSPFVPGANPDANGFKSGNPAFGGRRANDMTAAMDAGATNSIILPMATADVFTMFPDDALGLSGGTAWTPVFLFPITSSNVTLTDANDVPYSETHTGGLGATINFNTAPGHIIPQIKTITQGFFLGSMPDITGQFDGITNIVATPGGGTSFEVDNVDDPLRGDHYALRWPLNRRAIMYVARNTPGFQSRREDRSPASLDTYGASRPAESLFMWTGADGVENGRYDLYVITTEPLDAFENAPSLTAAGQLIIDSTDNESRFSYGIDVEAFTDRDGDGRVWAWRDTGVIAYPDAAAEISHSDPDIETNLNRGDQYSPFGGGTIASESMGQQQGLIPGADGVVYYGPVEVENNTLAVYLRNWADGGKLNRVSRIVLTPRRKERGRININTASTDFGDVDAVNNFNPLRGVPGAVVNMDIPGVNQYPNIAAGQIPGTIVYQDPTLSGLLMPGVDYGTPPGEGFALQASDIADRIVRARSNFEWVDGRYYLHPSNLLAYGHEVDDGLGVPGDSYLSDWNPGILSVNELLTNDFNPPLAATFYYNPETGLVERNFGGIVNNNAGTFTESVQRYRRMANLITTRSDVFEIIITAQAGYISSVDENGDGAVDFKSDFVSTGEKKIRVVYER